MRLLLIEDTTQLAGPIARELQDEHGHEVTWVKDPLEARRIPGMFDVAVVDLLFEHLSFDFDRRRLARQVRPTRDQLLITGLTAVADLARRSPSTKVVLWTSGEANRRLHLLYSAQELAIRAYCSKSSGTGKADTLHRAVLAAANDTEYVDPVLASYLPDRRSTSIVDTLLRDQTSRAIWRAVALGAHSREEIQDLTGYDRRTVGNRMPMLLNDLLSLDAGIIKPGKPLSEVVRFANRNWEFFLDAAVQSRHP